MQVKSPSNGNIFTIAIYSYWNYIEELTEYAASTQYMQGVGLHTYSDI